MNKYIRIALLSIPALLCMICIFRFSAETAEASADTSGSLIHSFLLRLFPDYASGSSAEQFQWIESLQLFVRKGAHFSIYALLAILCWLPAHSAVSSSLMSAEAAWGITVLYAISDELHQSFVPGRSCELRDVLIDSSGALCGLLLLFAVRWVIGRVRAGHSKSQKSKHA